MFIAALHNGVSRLYETFGNGGSAAQAQHLTAELDRRIAVLARTKDFVELTKPRIATLMLVVIAASAIWISGATAIAARLQAVRFRVHPKFSSTKAAGR